VIFPFSIRISCLLVSKYTCFVSYRNGTYVDYSQCSTFLHLFLDQFLKMVDTDIVKTFIKLDGEKEDVEETVTAKKKVANVVSGSRTAVIDQVFNYEPALKSESYCK